jgi:hypothetical protein
MNNFNYTNERDEEICEDCGEYLSNCECITCICREIPCIDHDCSCYCHPNE